jgi:anti-sigma B factor antagonist
LSVPKRVGISQIYLIFMVPKPIDPRLSTNMQTMSGNCQPWEEPALPAPLLAGKESKLKLSLEVRNQGDVTIVHSQGRIVYRDEAAALSCVVGEVLQNGSKVILDLDGVRSIDSAGMGELALLQIWAQERNATLKLAGANPLVSTLLALTNLDSVIDVHPSLQAALESIEEEPVCSDC